MIDQHGHAHKRDPYRKPNFAVVLGYNLHAPSTSYTSDCLWTIYHTEEEVGIQRVESKNVRLVYLKAYLVMCCDCNLQCDLT